MRFDILSLYPQLFENFFSEGLMGKSIEKKIIDIKIHNIREYGIGNHQQVDDTLYGGGAGMLLRFDVMKEAINKTNPSFKGKVIHLSPRGKRLSQKKAMELSKEKHLCVICGAFEGIDQRFIDEYVDEEISIGDYVLNRSEMAAMVLIESICRLLGGFMSSTDSHMMESFSEFSGAKMLEEDQYTKGGDEEKLPMVLRNGNHKEIESWRLWNGLLRTFQRRSDLFFYLKLKKKEIKMIMDFVYNDK